MSTEMAHSAITNAFDEAKSNPAEANVYAQTAIAYALLAVADAVKANTEALKQRES